MISKALIASALILLSSATSWAETAAEKLARDQMLNAGIKANLVGVPTSQMYVVNWALTCQSPCIIETKATGGGDTKAFIVAAMIIARDSKELQATDIVCRSACTIMMDFAAAMGAKTCVSWEVAWGVHTGHHKQADGTTTADANQYQYHAPAIAKWIAENGMKAGFRYRYVPSEIVEAAYGQCPNTAPKEKI